MHLISCAEIICHECAITIDINALKSRIVMRNSFGCLVRRFDDLHELLIEINIRDLSRVANFLYAVFVSHVRNHRFQANG